MIEAEQDAVGVQGWRLRCSVGTPDCRRRSRCDGSGRHTSPRVARRERTAAPSSRGCTGEPLRRGARAGRAPPGRSQEQAASRWQSLSRGGEREQHGCCDRVPRAGDWSRSALGGKAAGEVHRERPECKRCREDVRMRQRALREPDGIECGEERGDTGCDCSEQVLRQAIDREQRGGSDHAHKGARGTRHKAGDTPPAGKQKRRQRRMGVGDGAVRDQRSGAEEIPGCGNVIASLIPKVRKPQQRDV